jgi:hypothetical protein
MAYVGYRSRTVAIDSIFPSNIHVVFYSSVFPFPPGKEKLIGNVPMKRQNAAIRSMFFLALIMRIA